jgi:hypothetical protein
VSAEVVLISGFITGCAAATTRALLERFVGSTGIGCGKLEEDIEEEKVSSWSAALHGMYAKSMVELSLTALRAREVLKWRFVRGEVEVVEFVGREVERLLKERWWAMCSALRRAVI